MLVLRLWTLPHLIPFVPVCGSRLSAHSVEIDPWHFRGLLASLTGIQSVSSGFDPVFWQRARDSSYSLHIRNKDSCVPSPKFLHVCLVVGYSLWDVTWNQFNAAVSHRAFCGDAFGKILKIVLSDFPAWIAVGFSSVGLAMATCQATCL